MITKKKLWRFLKWGIILIILLFSLFVFGLIIYDYYFGLIKVEPSVEIIEKLEKGEKLQ